MDLGEVEEIVESLGKVWEKFIYCVIVNNYETGQIPIDLRSIYGFINYIISCG